MCPSEGCHFRANQRTGLKCHINSVQYVYRFFIFRRFLNLFISKNLRLPCAFPECDRTFSDPSSLTKHRQNFHGQKFGGRAHMTPGPSEARGKESKGRRHVPYSFPVHARVARHIKEQSGEDAKHILDQFTTFSFPETSPSLHDTASDDEIYDTRPSAPHGASSSSGPSSSTNRPTYTLRPCDRPGVFHRAPDVRIDRMSVDNNSQNKHQPANAKHPQAPQVPLGYLQPASAVAGPSGTARLQPSVQSRTLNTQGHTIEDDVEEFFASRPLRQDWMLQMQPRLTVLYPRNNHVLSETPAFPRPNAGILFDRSENSVRMYFNR